MPTNWDVINTTETANWETIVTVELKLVVGRAGGFAVGAFASGPFAGSGEASDILPVVNIWSTIDNSESAVWNVIPTQT